MSILINTIPANKLVRILKSKPVLMGMEQDSVDILLSGLIEQYMQRPDELEETCLVKFAAGTLADPEMFKRGAPLTKESEL